MMLTTRAELRSDERMALFTPVDQATFTGTTPSVAELLRGWDHLEWWVGNARAVTAWMAAGFGFDVVAYAGPETGVTDRVSYVLGQGDIRFVITAGLGPDSEVSR